MSDLERAQEWLGCDEGVLFDGGYCVVHRTNPGALLPDKAWPCPEATRLASLLTETRAEGWDEGKHSKHTIECDMSLSADCECVNPYRGDGS